MLRLPQNCGLRSVCTNTVESGLKHNVKANNTHERTQYTHSMQQPKRAYCTSCTQHAHSMHTSCTHHAHIVHGASTAPISPTSSIGSASTASLICTLRESHTIRTRCAHAARTFLTSQETHSGCAATLPAMCVRCGGALHEVCMRV